VSFAHLNIGSAKGMKTPEQIILREIERLRTDVRKPIVVALDGGSGAGKTTIAQRLVRLADVALVQLDDFYQTVIPESEWPQKTVGQRLNGVFDWSRVRSEALDPLRAGRPGRWHAFDFVRGLSKGGTYSLKEEVTEVAPAPTILVEGAYSASPRLRDLIDLAVLVYVQNKTRHLRAAVRERDDAEFLAKWHAIWDEVEAHYFQLVCPPESFDLVILNDDKAEPSAPAKEASTRRQA
jgi:para-aminobenzoate synthetase